MSKRMIGPFELGDKLGAGGMGIVYRAIYTKTNVPCAIKVLAPDVNDSPQVQQRFEREIAILKKLQHPHIVRYFGGGKVGPQRFYAMELVQGGSLEGYLREKKKLPWEEALDFAHQIALALEHAHAAGVIHRDLKPANLLMTAEHVLKLTDFGIARDTTQTALTAAGKTVGTYAYMAPEQIRGKPPVDRRTDLYALGCVIFEMIAGETPFDSDNPGEVLVQHLNEEPLRLTSLAPDCPIWIEDLVFKLLEKDPAERPYDALALQMAIQEIKQKISQQASVVGQTLAGNRTKTAGSTDQAELKAMLAKKKKKKKRDKSPFYERAWFLAVCLVLLIGGVTWTLQPAGEDKLMAQAEALIAKDTDIAWIDARDKFLEPLLKRFPDGKHASRAQDLHDKVEMRFAIEQARNRGTRPSKSEGEKLFIEADKFERFGDRISALQIYEGMMDLLKDREDERIYVLLAKQQADRINAEGGGKGDLGEIVEAALQRAEEQYAQGEIFKARQTWDNILTLYSKNQEMEPYVKQAQTRYQETRPGRKKSEEGQ